MLVVSLHCVLGSDRHAQEARYDPDTQTPIETQAQRVALLELMVDKVDLETILIELGLVCYEKGEHLRCNWQDNVTVRTWDYAGKACEAASKNQSVRTVSK